MHNNPPDQALALRCAAKSQCQALERTQPEELDMRLVADNYCTHQHARAKAWLDKQPRLPIHCPPMSASWLNLA